MFIVMCHTDQSGFTESDPVAVFRDQAVAQKIARKLTKRAARLERAQIFWSHRTYNVVSVRYVP